MCISLQYYQPLELTKSLIDTASRRWHSHSNNFLNVCKKVGTIALAILALVPYLLADLGLTAASFIYRLCHPRQPVYIAPYIPPAARRPIPPEAPVAVEPPPRPGRAIDAEMLARISEAPYPAFPPVAHTDFFTDGLRAAFGFLPEPKVMQYKELIENGGAAAEGEAPIDIFQWCASCLLAHYLRSRTHLGDHRTDHLFPKLTPDPAHLPVGQANVDRLARNRENGANIDRISQRYNALSRAERAAVAIQLIIPEERWQLTGAAEGFLRDAQAIVQTITQIQVYNTQIYAPVALDVDNI